METNSDLKTPLNRVHRDMGAHMVSFGGWDMPVWYSSILDEHRAVRNAAGLFDISHMGEIEFYGLDAVRVLQRLLTNDVSTMETGQVKYAALCYDDGTFVDDLTVYRISDDHFMLTVNTSNIAKDYEWICSHADGMVNIQNVSDETALLALQGPRALEILQRLTSTGLSQIPYYHFEQGKVLDAKAIVSRTGYTGEDGFELYVAPGDIENLWHNLLESGKAYGILPVGLGARDTLRLEARMMLYGNDIDDKHTVLEAGLGWIVSYDKGDFIGRKALQKQKDEGVGQRLVGFEMTGRGIARSHYKIVIDGETGIVTSGVYSPTLNRSIGLAYVPIEHAAIGTEIDVVIRENPVPAKVVPTPFYKRSK